MTDAANSGRDLGPAGPFGAWNVLDLPGGKCRIADLGALARVTGLDLARLPYSIRVLLENALRHCCRGLVEKGDVLALLDWNAADPGRTELAFMPGRVLLQDFTGVPCVVDLAAMRSAVARRKGDPRIINPSVPVDLVIDHSVQVDYAGTHDACRRNMELEMQRNSERYALLRWAQGEFTGLRIVPPGTGICHQVNLEYLAEVVCRGGNGAAGDEFPWAYPDTVIGTDSHTGMIDGLGVLGWGVGGIEAEAVMLGQPYPMLVPQVVGVRLTGSLDSQATATDLVLTVTELLRSVGVVGRFVEFFGPGVEVLSLADRATVANMSPEYGATCGFFPVDGETLAYLRQTGRPAESCARVEAYCRVQSLFRTADSPEPEYSRVVELHLNEVRPSLAGPRRPQDRVTPADMPKRLREELPHLVQGRERPLETTVEIDGQEVAIRDGHVVIASITSCTNTSNPALMLAAGLVARKAVELGLRVKPWVRTSLAPGSRAVTGYLQEAGLLGALEALGFSVVGYGCATCIGNSGPLDEELERVVRAEQLVVAAVLSGNRNFEGRIHAAVRASYLASPPLVVAYALAGTVDIDLTSEPVGTRADGRPVYLSDLWPDQEEVARLMVAAVRPQTFREEYEKALEGTEAWRQIEVPQGALFAWDPDSTYVREPPFFHDLRTAPAAPGDIRAAAVLAVLGDSVTTDHISPAGSIPRTSPAGRYLLEHNVRPADFNTYGSRRGNHEVLVRGTFANERLRNRMVVDREGGWTTAYPSGEVLPIYDAAMRCLAVAAPLVVLAGKEYGTGSSRDWAAKGPALLGVRAVIAESFERIHRSNLVGMGVLPLELEPGVTWSRVGVNGSEIVSIEGVGAINGPGATVTVRLRRPLRALRAQAGLLGEGALIGGRQIGRAETGGADPDEVVLTCRVRLDSMVEVEYFRHGGVLPYVLRAKSGGSA